MFATAAKSTCDEPIFHESTIIRAIYLDVLANFVFPEIVAEVNGLDFQQDGAPARFGAIVTQYSGRTVSWFMDRFGMADYLNLTESRLIDGLLLGYMKDIVCSRGVASLLHLNRRITAALASAPVDVLSGVWCGVYWCPH